MARVFPFACPTRASWEGSMCVMDWGFPLRTSRSQCCRDSISVSQALCILGMTHWGIQQQIKKINSRHPADSSDHLRFAKRSRHEIIIELRIVLPKTLRACPEIFRLLFDGSQNPAEFPPIVLQEIAKKFADVTSFCRRAGRSIISPRIHHTLLCRLAARKGHS